MNQNTELIRQAQSGDVHAFAQLYASIYQDLYRFAVCTLQNLQDAEDAVSEAVMDAFTQITSLREASAFKSWMFTILSAKCKRKIRQSLHAPEELPESLAAPEPAHEELLDVRRAFELLPYEDRMILALNLFAGYSSQEIGALMQLNPNTVRSRQSRALKKMESNLRTSY